LIEQYFLFISQPGDLIEIRGFPDRSRGAHTPAGLYTDMRKAALVSIMMADAQKAR
jgi:hypothetical protein